jgi:glycosyltransferase involved in cell wall biosynthesis
VVSYLTEELVRQGHEVTLFASGDSKTRARLQSPCARALRLDSQCKDPLPYHSISLYRLARAIDAFDIIHFHTDYLHFPLLAQHWGKTLTTLTTLHGRLDLPDLPLMLREFAMMPLVSISNGQRAPVPWANWYGTVYHGLPPSLYARGCGDGGYLGFIGRICPEKRPDWTGLGNRDRPPRRTASGNRGEGRQGRSDLLQDQDQAVAKRSGGRVHR